MRTWTGVIVSSCVLALLGACAATPKATLSYQHPRADAEIGAAMTVGCSKTNEIAVSRAVSSHAVTYSADYESEPGRIDLGGLDSAFANADFTAVLTPDGRLSSINGTQTGQDGAIIEAALAVVDLAGAADGAVRVPEACAIVGRHGKDGLLTLRFRALEPFKAGARFVGVSAEDQAIHDQLRRYVGSLCLTTANVSAATRVPAMSVARPDEVVLVQLVQPQPVRLSVEYTPTGGCGESSTYPLWEGVALVPQRGQRYDAPIPRAAMFGKQTFTLQLDPSGTITKLQYGSDSGTADALTSLAAVMTEMEGETTAEATARLTAEANFIAAQQRLVRCRTTPESC